MKYVYPVVSRRAGGVSLGINLNPNNACNFRCIYCQVPDLVAGKAPRVDMVVLRSELSEMLHAIVCGDFLERHVPASARRLQDVAISGNGEPTSSSQLAEVLDEISTQLERVGLRNELPVVLISNGSLMLKPHVGLALEKLSALGGEVWFKIDSATDEGIAATNSSIIGAAGQLARLQRSASLCRTLIQGCFFERRGKPPTEPEQRAYLALIAELVRQKTPIAAVLLYGLARPSHQPEAAQLAALDSSWLQAFAERIRKAGIPVKVSG